MATTLNTAIRGEQITDASISGAHIIDAAITPVKLSIVNSPDDGDVLTYNASNSTFEWEKVGTLIANESPTGSINGTNTMFMLSATPEANSLEVYLNGLLQQPGVGNDYTVSGTLLTFTSAPEVGDIILCSYLTSAGLGGGYYTDHGNLSGLGDDDHLQYILVDGSRAFSGVANYNAHKSFTADTNLVDKKYVDDLVSTTSGTMDHGTLQGLSDDDHTQYVLADGTRVFSGVASYDSHKSFTADTNLVDKKYVDDLVSAASGTMDHGSLLGLADNDHTQYLMSVAGAPLTVTDQEITFNYDSSDFQLSGDNLQIKDSGVDHDATTNFVAEEHIRWDLSQSPTYYVHADNIPAGGVTQYNNLLDHGTLQGLSDDDHTQYVLADGTRVFSGVASYDSHKSFTADTNLVDKKYVDDAVAGLSQDSITEGNSKVEVVDAGTGYVTVEIDDSEVARFVSGGLNLTGDLLPDMTSASGSVSIHNIGSASAKFNTVYCHDLRADAGSVYVNDKKVIEDVSNVITISTDPDQRLKVVTTGDAGDLYFSGEGGIQIVVPSTYSNHDITISNNSSGGDINIGGTGQTIKINGTVDLSNGTIDHGDLAGLADDDHTQYILVDGSRSFTGAVSGITPTDADHLATKSYVDSLMQGLDWQDSVLDKDLTAPPGTPSAGDRYLVANSATGAWSGHDGDIAEWDGSTWAFQAKSEGMAVWVEDENRLYTYNGSAWVVFGSTISHNNTAGLNDGDYKHLTASQFSDLTGGGDSSLHTHDDRYYTEAEADARFVLTTDYEDTDVLAKIKNVDGTGSGLDADTLDGSHASAFASSSHNHDATYVKLTDYEDTDVLTKIKNVDGTGSGLDADTLDGSHASVFLKNDGSSGGNFSTSGFLQEGRGSGGVALTHNDGKGNANVVFNHISGIPEQDGNAGRIEVNTDSTSGAYMTFELKSGVSKDVSIDLTETLKLTETAITFLGNTVWHAGNDGSGSGLDADKLDGLQGSSYFLVDGTRAITGQLSITGTTREAGKFYAGTTAPSSSDRMNYDGYFYATRVYNAVYNDIADFQKVDDEIVYGKVYRLTESGAKICNERCQLGVIGVCSDTYGYGVGVSDEGFAPFAVSGWVLAYVDKTYIPGTPLTCDENGNLTEMSLEEKRNYPERIVAIYDRPETAEFWGPNNEVKVNGRHWVKVK